MSAHRRLETGIDGLDLILDGGLRYPAEGSVFLVILGGPGTGKTHLALELTTRMLSRPEGAGGIHLYYGLDQSPADIHAKLREDFDYFGIPGPWNRVSGAIQSGDYEALLHAVQGAGDRSPCYLLSASLRDDGSTPRGPQELIERLDRDLTTITEASGLGDELRGRVVTIDSISLKTFDDGSGVRHALRSIRHRLARRRMHGIFVVETPPGEAEDRADFAAAEYATDVMVHLGYHQFGDSFKERSIEITKARHQFYFRGTHHFSIVGKSDDQLRGARGQRPPGLHIYPSVPTLLSYLQYRSASRPPPSDQLALGIGDGRVRRGSSNGLIGPPGEVGLLHRLTRRFLLADDDPSLLIGFHQHADEMLAELGGEAETERARERLLVRCFEPEYMSSGKFLKDVYDELEGMRARGLQLSRTALVGLEHLKWGFPLLHDARMLIPWLTVFFRHQQITSLFVDTAYQKDTELLDPESAVSATVDNLFLLETARPDGPRLLVRRSRSAQLPDAPIALRE